MIIRTVLPKAFAVYSGRISRDDSGPNDQKIQKFSLLKIQTFNNFVFEKLSKASCEGSFERRKNPKIDELLNEGFVSEAISYAGNMIEPLESFFALDAIFQCLKKNQNFEKETLVQLLKALNRRGDSERYFVKNLVKLQLIAEITTVLLDKEGDDLSFFIEMVPEIEDRLVRSQILSDIISFLLGKEDCEEALLRSLASQIQDPYYRSYTFQKIDQRFPDKESANRKIIHSEK